MRNQVIVFLITFSLTAALEAQSSKAPSKGETPGTAAITTKIVTVPKDSSSGVKELTKTPVSEKADSLNPLKFSRPTYIYNSGGKRDPFGSLVPEQVKEDQKIKGLFNYEKATLQGIVNTDSSRYAFVIDGDKYGHVLREGDKVLGGNVTQITADAVYFHIVKYSRPMTIIMRLEAARSTIISKEEEDIVVRKPGINLSYETGSTPSKTISIENVVVPSLNTKTVEEVWFGGEAKKAEEPIAEGINTLFDPPDNASIGLPHLFRWTKSPDDSLYTLIICGDRDFTTPLLVKEGLNTSSFLMEENTSLPFNRTLYWKIMVTYKSGKIASSLNILSFRITDLSDRGKDNEKK
jgi:hypothetical protein